MVSPIRKVLDISHHNIVMDLDAVKEAGILGIIHKATESTAYVDDKYAPRKKGFLEIGMLWGAYHFFHPGKIREQCDFFLRVAGVDDRTLYALDWEQSSSGTATEEQAQQFLEWLESETGRKGVVYSGNAAKEQIHGTNKYLGAHRLWLAHYSPNPTTQQSWGGKYWLWQYSDGRAGPQPHGCPGVSGEVDTNSWAGTDEELRAQWSGLGTAPGPSPEPDDEARVEITARGNVVVVVNGKEVYAPGKPSGISPNHQNITATIFRDDTTAYPPFDAISETEFAVSLPANIPDEVVRDRGVRVYNRATNKNTVGKIRDKGPWLVDDTAYINSATARPLAETCYKNGTPLPRGPHAGTVPTNDAGIDLSPALAKAIGIAGKGKVDWEFVT